MSLSGSHWWWMRPKSTACCSVMSKSTTLSSTCSTELMMVGPPGLPRAIQSLPSLSTSVGVIDDSGRFFGAMALASPWTSPKALGTPTLLVKSSISSLSR